MVMSTSVVLVICSLTVLFGAMSRMESTRPLFSTLGMSDLVSAPVSRRMLVGTLASISGGMLAAVWVWVIQRQSIIGSTTLCESSSGCAQALSSQTMNTIPFSNLEFGLFFILMFSILGFLALSIHLEPTWSKAGGFLSWGRTIGGISTLIALWMTITHLLMVDDSPAICPICIVLLAANIVTMMQFNLLLASNSDGSWNSN
ncbi:MAG: hypothetical protein P8Q39_02660 [Candidatus Thalassarchaeaceae archaeon]|jgi:hypothetical protein|nr:hypothetical protein [Candidatus Thalassarchaeaceae archaeon]